MRDENLIFHDGTNFTGNITPASLTRTGGSAVLDISKSPIRGLWVQASLAAAIVGSGSPTIDVKVQYCDLADFSTGVEDGPSFPQLTGSTPAGFRRALKCQSKRRYWRCLIVKGGTTLTSETLYLHVASGPNRDDNA